MSIIYLIRHGQSEANEKHLWGGDLPLTEKGRQDALLVPSAIPVRPDRIISSELKRANMTAHIAYPGEEIEVNPAFNEIAVGNLDMVPMTMDMVRLCIDDPYGFLRECGGDDLHERAVRAHAALTEAAKGCENLAVFTSDLLIRTIILYLQGRELSELSAYYITNCAVVILEYDGQLKIRDASAMVKMPPMK